MKLRLIMLFLGLAVLLCPNNTRATNGKPWYRTFEEVKQLYTKHYNRESRLENYIYIENGKYIATIFKNGNKKVRFVAPDHFIHSMLNHLKAGLDNDWFNYIFWADLNHGHLFIPDDLRENYSKFENEKYFKEILKDRNLGILYHAAEHFCSLDPENTKYIQTRNIVGWFNSKPIEIIFPESDTSKGRLKANTASVPKGYSNVWWIGISASKDGTFSIEVDGKTIKLDISLEVSSIYDSTTERERTLTGE